MPTSISSCERLRVEEEEEKKEEEEEKRRSERVLLREGNQEGKQLAAIKTTRKQDKQAREAKQNERSKTKLTCREEHNCQVLQ